ncbi:MAG TPA: hypothetical protein VGO60_08440 [Iamia sp.]|jgi:uncharacterized protein YbjT (DUF2867 family)|nr:hypothetical protein [Iamia sp.]
MTTPTTSTPTVVIGATGKTGRRVAAQLETAGQAVRPASRSLATRFDWDDPTTWAPALDGAAGLYLVPPESGDLAPFVAEVERSSVDRVVLLSARALGQSGDDHLERFEDAVTGSTRPWTILRPSWFAQNFDEGFYAPGIAEGALRLPVGTGREPFIDADDIAAVAVAALTEPGHEGRIYELSGPEAITFTEAVAVIAEASGRDLVFAAVEPDAWAAEMRGHEVPPPVIDLLGHLFAAIRAGENDHVSTGVTDALGRPPTTFAAWARKAFGS